MDIIGLISFIATIALLALSLFQNVKFLIGNKKLSDNIASLENDKELLYSKILKLSQDFENKKLQESDGFVNFLSESRDSAFKYIESVQKTLIEFSEVLEAEMKYKNTYGLAMGETPYTAMLNRIEEAYNKLKDILPDELNK